MAFQERSVRSSDGTTLHYSRAGTGPPLLLCDGLLCDGHVWKYLIPALVTSRECVHWNYPGHGKSQDPFPWTDLSVERLADDAAAVIQHAGLKSVVLVGHSLGVQVALETWHRHRELVSGLVLLCGSPGRIIEDFHEGAILEVLVPLLDVFVRFLPSQAGKIWKALPTHWLLKLTMLTSEVNSRLIRAPDIGAYLGRMTRVDFKIGLRILESAGRHDASGFLQAIDVPTLIIAGENDSFTPAARSQLMGEQIPGAELMMVKAGTHSLPIELPELVNMRIRRFLEERPG